MNPSPLLLIAMLLATLMLSAWGVYSVARTPLDALPAWIGGDAMRVLADLGQPLFFGAVATAAACFALLVYRRTRP